MVMATTPHNVTVTIRLRAPLVDQLAAANHILTIDIIRSGHWPRLQLTTDERETGQPIKIVRIPETISQDEADQIRRAIEQVESKSSED